MTTKTPPFCRLLANSGVAGRPRLGVTANEGLTPADDRRDFPEGAAEGVGVDGAAGARPETRTGTISSGEEELAEDELDMLSER